MFSSIFFSLSIALPLLPDKTLFFTDFIALSGDRYYAEDKSVIAGFAKFNDKSVLLFLEHEKTPSDIGKSKSE